MKLGLITITFILTTALWVVGCQSKDPETGYPIIEKDKTFVVGAYLKKCSCFVEKQCLVINEKTECEGIRGFTHEKGVQKTILVDVYERTDDVQDVGKYGYILKRGCGRKASGKISDMYKSCIDLV